MYIYSNIRLEKSHHFQIKYKDMKVKYTSMHVYRYMHASIFQKWLLASEIDNWKLLEIPNSSC
jgi:hypothetical protein